jgi:glycosyltransferase involved in cell wall biosynthesis
MSARERDCMISPPDLTIAIDTWPLHHRFRKTGIYVYALNLLSRFHQIAEEGSIEFRPLVSPRNSSAGNKFRSIAGFRPYSTNLLNIGRAWRYGGACLAGYMSKADVLFCPSGNIFPIRAMLPVVTTIHDVIPLIFSNVPKARGLAFAFANAAKFSKAIITDSACSKRDLVEAFKLPPSKVHVTYLACDPLVFNDYEPNPSHREALLAKLGINRPFIIHHGRIQERKNVKRLVEAYGLLMSRKHDLEVDLVLVGEFGQGHEKVVAAANAVSHRGRVIFAGSQDDADLAVLLKAAALAVIPSLYEGFGLPLLEAMTCGTATVCSNSSCLPEISGGELLYFDPYSIYDMANCIEHVLENSGMRRRLGVNGKRRAALFSWDRCAQETLTILKSATR